MSKCLLYVLWIGLGRGLKMSVVKIKKTFSWSKWFPFVKKKADMKRIHREAILKTFGRKVKAEKEKNL